MSPYSLKMTLKEVISNDCEVTDNVTLLIPPGPDWTRFITAMHLFLPIVFKRQQ